MGLSGRKQKQKIQNDPRNLSWADDASRFGSSYLSKFGWDSSKGLGATGEGMISHIKVSQKLDMMGIGAAHQKDPNGIAWKQNRDFENLLKRLNAASGTTETATLDVEMKEGFVVQTTTQVKEEKEEEKAREKRDKRKEKEEKKEKKRKHENEEEERSEKKKRRKSSEEPSEKKSKETPTPAPTPAPTKQAAPPRHRAHRARAIAAKSISHKSSVHISEILGIAPSASTSESTSAIASGSATPAEQGKLTVISELEKLTTSTKSVADYFKEKLQLKSSKASSVSITPADSSESSTPTVGLGMSRKTSDWEDERPAGGLGFGAGGLGFGGGGLGFQKVRLEVNEECNVVEGATMRMGLSKFSSLTSSKFLTSKAMNFDVESATPEVSESKIEEVVGSSSSEEESREERKKRRKAKKERKKAEAAEKEKRKEKEKKDKKQEDSVEKRARKEKKEREKEKSKKAEEA